MTQERLKRYRLGLWAESLAAFYLRGKGYRIMARRFKSPLGEIDLIARRGNVLAFIEVKLRADHDAAALSVTPRTKQRIERAARLYLSRHQAEAGRDHRFDVITVRLPFSVRHIDNAWRPDA
jgi:putative endonuclease